MIRRTTIAMAWIAGATVPLLAAVVFLFGCCVLPFHAYLHKVMPLCHVAMTLINGEHDHHHGDALPALPASQKQEPVQRFATEVPHSFHLDTVSSIRRATITTDTLAFRSFISLGALRCDQDVGLHLLLSILLI